MKHKTLKSLTGGIIVLTFFCITLGFSGSLRPLTFNSSLMPEKLYVRYAWYVAGKLWGYTHIVYIMDKKDGRNLLRIYRSDYFYFPDYKILKKYAYLPLHLEDFPSLTIVDADKFQIMESKSSWGEVEGKLPVGEWISNFEYLDYSNSIYVEELTTWDGYKEKFQRSTTKVDLSLPILNFLGSAIFLPIGFLNLEEKGYGQVVVPRVLKVAPKGSFKIVKEERLQTPLGVFETMKVKVQPNDILLSLLYGRNVDNFGIFWIDKKSRHVVKRIKENVQELIMEACEEFTNWSDVAKKLNSEWVEQVCLKKLGVK